MKAERFYPELVDQTALFADAVHGIDPSTPVPTCPGWTVADLVDHVGIAHRWVAVMVERRADQPISKAEADDHDIPTDPDGRSAWLVAGARRLAGAVREAGPDTAMWTWSPVKTAGFWLRRITHETLVHRVDAEVTAGRDVTIAADLAADGISDLLETFAVLPKIDDLPKLAALCRGGEVVSFEATDGGWWLVTGGESGLSWEHGHDAAGGLEPTDGPEAARRPDVTVRGSAADLLLVLTRRAAPDQVEVHGDQRLFQTWLESAIF